MTRFIKRRKEIKPSNQRKKSSQKEKPSTTPCMICGNPSTGQYAFDIDLPKFPFCEKDKFSVFMYLNMVVTGDVSGAESFLSFAKELPDAKSKTNTKATPKKRKRNSKGQ